MNSPSIIWQRLTGMILALALQDANLVTSFLYCLGNVEAVHWQGMLVGYTAQKMKFSIKNFFSEFDQICRKLRIWLHLLKKSLMENFFCAVL